MNATQLLSEMITALRSDKYVQCFNADRNYRQEFCAIGVGQDVLNPNGWKEDDFYRWIWNNDKSLSQTIGSQLIVRIINWNDRDHFSFKEIANKLDVIVNDFKLSGETDFISWYKRMV